MLDAIIAFIKLADPKNEVELRFKEPGLQGVEYDTYCRIIEYFQKLNSWKRTTEKSTVSFYKHKRNNHEIRVVNGVAEEKRRVYVQNSVLRNKLKMIEDEYNVRCSESIEKKVNVRLSDYNKIFERQRSRVSFRKGSLRVDISQVKQKDNIQFEIEMEIIGKIDDGVIVKGVMEMIQLVQGGNNVFTNTQFRAIDAEFGNLLSMKYVKFPGPLPYTLTTDDIDKISCGYSVTDKADGMRYILFSNKIGQIFLISRPKGKSLSYKYFGVSPVKNVILDGELVKNTYYAFDILYYGGDLREKHLEDRLNALAKAVSDYGLYKSTPAASVGRNKLNNKMGIKIKMKTFYISESGGSKKFKFTDRLKTKLRMSKDIFETAYKIYKKSHPYELDGVIFTPIHKGYYNDRIFKWKEFNTVDFYCDNKKLHIAGHVPNGKGFNEYKNLPFEGVDGRGGFKFMKGRNILDVQNNIFVDKAANKLTREGVAGKSFEKHNGFVVECKYNGTEFVFMKRRSDKVKANNINVTNDAWKAIRNPVNLKNLNKSVYSCIRKYHNAIKKYLITKHCKAVDVLDIGSGAGGDIQKYVDAQSKSVIGIDIVDVQYPYPKHMKFIKVSNPIYSVQDVLDNHKISQKKFDVINIHFAMHYFFKNQNTLDNFAVNVFESLKKGGRLIATVIDGNQLHDIFTKGKVTKGKTLSGAHKDKPVFKITRNYSKLGLVGNAIEVKLYGTKYFNNKSSEEYAVNIDEFIKYFQKYKMKIVSRTKFGAYDKYPEFSQLNPSERKYSKLNTVLVFEKM